MTSWTCSTSRRTLAAAGINTNFDQGVYDAYNALIAGGATTTAAASAAVASSNGVPFRTGTSKDNLSGKAVLQVDLNRAVMAYASYARGYKGPAYNVFYNLTATGTNVIAPETSDAFEAGLKNSLLGGRLQLNIAGFYASITISRPTTRIWWRAWWSPASPTRARCRPLVWRLT
jgi:iron complex outermembrane receptor protein